MKNNYSKELIESCRQFLEQNYVLEHEGVDVSAEFLEEIIIPDVLEKIDKVLDDHNIDKE